MIPAALTVLILVVVLVGAGIAFQVQINGLKKHMTELKDESSDALALVQGEINKLKQRTGV